MQTWAKYCLGLFALILILTGFILALGPASNRKAIRGSERATGQLRADHETHNPGESATPSPTESGTQSGTTHSED